MANSLPRMQQLLDAAIGREFEVTVSDDKTRPRGDSAAAIRLRSIAEGATLAGMPPDKIDKLVRMIEQQRMREEQTFIKGGTAKVVIDDIEDIIAPAPRLPTSVTDSKTGITFQASFPDLREEVSVLTLERDEARAENATLRQALADLKPLIEAAAKVHAPTPTTRVDLLDDPFKSLQEIVDENGW